MSDKINVTIECCGWEIVDYAQYLATKQTKISGDRKAFCGDDLVPWSGGSLGVKIPFYIESDTPGKFHKFMGMEYLGLVETLQDRRKMLTDLITKFQGALVLDGGNGAVVVTYKDDIIAEGCGQILACLKESINPIRNTSVGTFYKICNPVISLEMISAARNLGNQFIKEYERMMAL